MEKVLAEINNLSSKYRTDIGEGNPSKDVICVIHQLLKLSGNEEWGQADQKVYKVLLKKMDITGKLYVKYSLKWKKITNIEIDIKTYTLLFLIIAREMTSLIADAQKNNVILKRFNTLFKLHELLPVGNPKLQSQILEDFVNNEWNVIRNLKLPPLRNINIPSLSEISDSKTPKVIPLTVLFYEGPIARAYLQTIRSLGYRPEKIIQLISRYDLVSKKPIGKWLPKSMRLSYLENQQSRKIHYWANTIERKYQDFVCNIRSSIDTSFGFSEEMQSFYSNLEPLSNYADNIDRILFSRLSDDELHTHISELGKTALLYTGGGIVPKKLLSIPHAKFIHIHPGFLPKIRGADCALWSILTTGHPSASSFFMAPGIDDGDVIKALWLPKFNLTSLSALPEDLNMQYRSVYSYIDPWIRSYTLREVLHENDEFYHMDSNSQDHEDGMMYHFAHTKIRRLALKKFFGKLYN
jgi:hypothetical protein